MRKSFLFLVLLALTFKVGLAEVSPLQKEIFMARDKVLPALVHIQPVITDFRTGKMRKQSVVGSGVIFHKDGYVVTNYHVAGKAERIICTMPDKEQVKAELIGGDPLTDIAVIKLDLSEYSGSIQVVEFGDSDQLQVGQYVLAMGSPLALARSVSCGVISTTDRYFPGETRLPSGEKTGIYNNWIQTDAAINPGNSGGPLVDLNGKIVGINSRATLFANNIGFSIPINIVKEVIKNILEKGKVTRSWIGVQCQELQNLESWFGTEINEGVLVSSIDSKSPAEEAGLRAGDIILKMDQQPVSARFAEELPAFYKKVADHPIGSNIEMTILRKDKTIYVNVETHELGEILGEDLECKEWGFTVKGITKQMAVENLLEDTLGVFVSGVKRVGAAADAGLLRGDIIQGLNEQPTLTFEKFFKTYNEVIVAGLEKVLLTVKRSGSTKFVLIKVNNHKTAEENK
ncbi:MAG: peptidase S1 [candidate division Zixibacteria bacterium HGW-Zixibacteria-1]|nr:MAG: peptidase S1 [candidate division Zixibacteria bacterium HGW-Zixibacteria-1]